jgi:hypothetical protein
MADARGVLREAETAFQELRAAVTGLDEAQMGEPWLGVWGVREILVHISGWHREMVPALERLARGEAPFPSGVSYDDYDAWNARFVAARKGVATPDVLAELNAAHRAFIGAATRLPDEQLAKGGAAHDLFQGVGPGHYREHTTQILGWRSRRP